MQIFQFQCYRAHHDTEHEQSETGYHDHRIDADTQRIDKYEDREYQKKNASTYDPCSAMKSEGFNIPTERDYHETVIEKAYSHHYRKGKQTHGRINTEKYTEKQIYDSSDYDISAHHKIVAAGGSYYKLSRTGDQDQYAEEDAQRDIALERKYKYSYAESDG